MLEDFKFSESDSFTISGWAKQESGSGAEPVLFGVAIRYTSEDPRYGLIMNNAGSIRIYLSDGVDHIDSTYPNILNDGQWHYLAWVVNRGDDSLSCVLKEIK